MLRWIIDRDPLMLRCCGDLGEVVLLLILLLISVGPFFSPSFYLIYCN